MAGSAADDRLVQSRRRRREMEDGEVASGYYTGGSDTDTDDEDARYYLHPLSLHDHRQGMMVTVARPGPVPAVLEDVVGGRVSAGSRSRSTTRASSPTSSLGSDGTISDVDAAGGDPAAVTTLFPACPVCHMQFHNSKAVHGHMRVHAQAKPKEEEKVSAAVSAVHEVGDSVSVSMANVVAEPKTPDDRMTVEVASSQQVVAGSSSGSSSRASVEPSQSAADLSMAIVVAEAAAPAAAPKQVNIAPTPRAQQQDLVPQPADVYPPSPAQQHVALPQAFHGPLHIVPRQDPTAPRGFSCKECNRWFRTHQGLGGHAAGHKNRRIAAAAAAAIAAGVDPIAAGVPKPEKLHPCKVCGEVYTSGVRLGGHMRKHYTGKPIVQKKRARRLLPPDAVRLAIPGPATAMLEAPVVAPAVEVAAPQQVVAQPPQAPVVPAGCLRLFGVTIMEEAKKEEEPAVDEKQ